MPNKLRFAALGGAAAICLGLAWWLWQASGRVKGQPEAAGAPEVSAEQASLEAAVRSAMPALGLFKPIWLRRDSAGLNLKLPRLRDASAIGAGLKSALSESGIQPKLFEMRNFSQWRGFVFDTENEHLVAVQDKAPALALVIDDWGYHRQTLQALKEFPAPLTVAVLPGLSHSREIAEAAHAAGHEVILHLPMEPERKMPMLDGTLLSGMRESEIESLLERHAASVPHMAGLNNHEGSKGSADPVMMRIVAAWLKRHGGYFLDSRTSAKSVAEAEARRAGVPHAARKVFLDNVDKPAEIEKAARLALKMALRKGSCIAIGHPRPNTLAVLARLAPEFTEAGVDLVRASELTHFELNDGR